MPESFRTEKRLDGRHARPRRRALRRAKRRGPWENFPISDLRLGRPFIAALGLIKWACAEVNHSLGVLDDRRRSLIQQAAQEVIDGKLDSQFVVDVFQTGSGTSTNMNANEVIASRANEIATGKRGGKEPVHPNDHVNMQQSSNDAIPTAIHVAAVGGDAGRAAAGAGPLGRGAGGEGAGVRRRGEDRANSPSGRDADPAGAGVERACAPGATRRDARPSRRSARSASCRSAGRPVGTGINSHPDFARRAIKVIAEKDGHRVRRGAESFRGTGGEGRGRRGVGPSSRRSP